MKLKDGENMVRGARVLLKKTNLVLGQFFYTILVIRISSGYISVEQLVCSWAAYSF